MSNPFSRLIVTKTTADAIQTIRRADDRGRLYEIFFKGPYHPPWALIRKIVMSAQYGCSAFLARNEKGELFMGRNYDFPQFDGKENLIAVDVMVRLQFKGKYRSVNFADAAFLREIDKKILPGALDDGKTDVSLSALLPCICMDGMNEKGLAATILALDVKEGETPVYQKIRGRREMIVTELLREIIDTCATVEQAICLAGHINLVHTGGTDNHIMVTDSAGKAAVLEWRYNRLKITRTDAATNFYVGFDDAETIYYGKELKEKFGETEKTKKKYHYGYGHGYGRFQKIVKTLEGHRKGAELATMTEEEMLKTLSEVSQEYTGKITSYTQYSALYNLTAKDVRFYQERDYNKKYYWKI